jgi:hypothetical protein
MHVFLGTSCYCRPRMMPVARLAMQALSLRNWTLRLFLQEGLHQRTAKACSTLFSDRKSICRNPSPPNGLTCVFSSCNASASCLQCMPILTFYVLLLLTTYLHPWFPVTIIVIASVHVQNCSEWERVAFNCATCFGDMCDWRKAQAGC